MLVFLYVLKRGLKRGLSASLDGTRITEVGISWGVGGAQELKGT